MPVPVSMVTKLAATTRQAMCSLSAAAERRLLLALLAVVVVEGRQIALADKLAALERLLDRETLARLGGNGLDQSGGDDSFASRPRRGPGHSPSRVGRRRTGCSAGSRGWWSRPAGRYPAGRPTESERRRWDRPPGGIPGRPRPTTAPCRPAATTRRSCGPGRASPRSNRFFSAHQTLST